MCVNEKLWQKYIDDWDLYTAALKEVTHLDFADDGLIARFEEAIINNDVDKLEYLIDLGMRLDAPISDEMTPMALAVKEGCVDVVRFLLGKGCNFGDEDANGKPVYAYAVYSDNEELFKIWRSRGVAGMQWGNTYLFRLASTGQAESLDSALAHGRRLSQLNEVPDHAPTILGAAARKGHLDAVRVLLRYGANPDIRGYDWYGLTALMWAAREGHLDIVKEMVEHGATIDLENQSGQTALYQAAKSGHLDVAKYLIEAGANVEAGEYLLPLAGASSGGHREMVCFLLERGASVHVNGFYDRSPLGCACAAGHLEIANLLIARGACVNEAKHHTPLTCAAQNGHLEIVSLLLEHGADPNVKGPGGETAMLAAAEAGQWDIVKLLEGRGADIWAIDGRGNSLLLHAARRGDFDAVKLLLGKNDSKVEKQDLEEPLLEAFRDGHETIVSMLKARGVHHSLICPELLDAVRSGNIEDLRELLDQEADPNAEDRLRCTALETAVVCGNLEAAALLLERGATIKKCLLGETAAVGDFACLELLLAWGADVNAPDCQYVTPLVRASQAGRADVVRLLLEHGANVNGTTQDRYEDTALMWASWSGHTEIVGILLEHGADVDAESSDGLTAMQWAEAAERLDIMELLQRHINQ